MGDDRSFKGKRLELKCINCHNTRHLTDQCWQLHPELKPRFSNEQRGLQKRTNYKAHLAYSTLSTDNFIANPAALMQDFANYLQDEHNHEKVQSGITRTAGQEQHQQNSTTLISHLTNFLAETNINTSQSILTAFMTILELDNMHDLWIVDSGATDRMSNKLINFSNIERFVSPAFVSVANEKGSPMKGKGKSKIVSKIMYDVLYVPSFPFQLLSVNKITSIFNCDVIFTQYKIIFQDRLTKKMIGEGFFLHGLYYFFSIIALPKALRLVSKHHMSHSYGIVV